MIAPFFAPCNLFNRNRGSCVPSTLSGAGYLCCSEEDLQVYDRIESLKLDENPSRGSGHGQFESTSTISRQHMSAD